MSQPASAPRIPSLRFPEFNGGWEEKEIIDFAPLQRGFDLPVSEINLGAYPVVFSNGILKFHNKYKVVGPGVVTGRSGTIGNVTFVEDNYWPHNTSLWVTDFNNNYPKFVYYFYVHLDLTKFSSGSGVPTLNRNDVHKHIIHITDNIHEQTKIAAFLSSVDTKIDQLSQKKALLEQYKKGVMQQIFSQQIRFKADDGSDYPEWEEKRLGEVATFFSGGTPKSTNKAYYSGHIPFIGSGKINSSEVEQFITDEALENSSAKLVNKGDLLYALYGATSGEVAISKLDGAINQAVLCIRSEESIKFIYFWLCWQKENILSTYLQGGQGNLSAQIIKALILLLPNLEEQTKIANFLSAIDSKIEQVALQLEAAKQFKKGLLQQMFV